MTGSGAAPAVTIALGRCDGMRADVVLRVETAGDTSRTAISGTLTGPHRGRDTTLPVTTRLQPAGAAGVTRAILTEPAYWTPDLPNLYRLEATIESGDSPPRSIDRLVGLRRLGIRGRSLWHDAHRWVPRGVPATAADFATCKAAGLAALVTGPDEATLARADEIGVAVLALVPASRARDVTASADLIAAWAAHASVALAVLPADLPLTTVAEITSAARPIKGTLLLAASLSGARPPPVTMPPGIDCFVVVIDSDATPHEAWRNDAGVPLVAWRHGDARPEAGRSNCDVLQAALAAWGTAGGRDTLPWDWAGYVVGPADLPTT